MKTNFGKCGQTKLLLTSLLAVVLLSVAGCGEKNADENKPVTAAPVAQTKELTPEEKFAEMKRKAEAGDVEAQFNIGVMYRNGLGVPKANKQDVGANEFKIIPVYPEIAMEWWQKAAGQGHAGAQFELGLMYGEGLFILKDAAKAVEWYQKAAAQGNVNAQFNLGLMYDNGEGVPKDAAKAVEWYQKAAAQGDATAQSNLGVMYRLGEGVPKDAAKAVEWWQKAAAQGQADAQTNLSHAFRTGDGVSRNLVLAYAWSNLAAAQGNDVGRENRDIYESQLTPAQRAEGQRLASNWKKGNILQASSGSAADSISPDGKPSKKGTGTAFAVSGAGHALTNHHVINGCAEVKVAGREGIAKVITSDSVNDLALLQLPGNTKNGSPSISL